MKYLILVVIIGGLGVVGWHATQPSKQKPLAKPVPKENLATSNLAKKNQSAFNYFCREAVIAFSPCASVMNQDLELYEVENACFHFITDKNKNIELYSWTEAMSGSTEERAQGICPTGWHIPSRCELITLGLEDFTALPSIKSYKGIFFKPGDPDRELFKETVEINESGRAWTSSQEREVMTGKYDNAAIFHYKKYPIPGNSSMKILGSHKDAGLPVACVLN